MRCTRHNRQPCYQTACLREDSARRSRRPAADTGDITGAMYPADDGTSSAGEAAASGSDGSGCGGGE